MGTWMMQIIKSFPALFNNNNLFYIAPQQQLYELLALYRSTNAIEHTSMLLKLAQNNNLKR